MEFIKLAEKRYSCRNISDKNVEKDKIDKIIEAARLAPTACNLQPFKIWIIQNEEHIRKVEATTGATFGAKLFFVIGAQNDLGWIRKYDKRNFADVDASIVATHMMMEIEDLGLSTTWVGHFDAEKMKKLFPPMAGYDLIALFPVGYAEEDAEPADLHEKRKPAEELTEWLQ